MAQEAFVKAVWLPNYHSGVKNAFYAPSRAFTGLSVMPSRYAFSLILPVYRG